MFARDNDDEVNIFSTRKADVVNKVNQNPSRHGSIIYRVGMADYHSCKHYDNLLDVLKRTQGHPKIHEYINSTQPVNLFFDIDMKMPAFDENEIFNEKEPVDDSEDDGNYMTKDNVLEKLHERILPFIGTLKHRRVVLTAHSATKASFHVIYKLSVDDNMEVMMRNKTVIKNMCKTLRLDQLKDKNNCSVIDIQVYNDGTLRTYLSIKSNKDVRPFLFARYSEHISELEGFIGYCADDNPALKGREQLVDAPDFVDTVIQTTTLPEQLDQAIRQFVHREFNVPLDQMRKTDKFGEREPFSYTVDFKHNPCRIAKREHKSNTQFVVISTKKATYRCHDLVDCQQDKENRITVEFKDYGEVLQNLLMRPNSQTKKDALDLIKLKTNDVPPVSPKYNREKNELHFTETPLSKFRLFGDNGTHVLSQSGLSLKKPDFQISFPQTNEPLSPAITNYFLVQNNYFGNPDDAVKQIKIPPEVFDDAELTDLWEDAINLTDEDSLAELFCRDEKRVVYSNQSFYFYQNPLWIRDDEGIYTKSHIKSKLVAVVKKITKSFQGDAVAMNTINKARKMLGSNKTVGNIMEWTKTRLTNPEFVSLLDSNRRLIPFKNGVWDIVLECFRKCDFDDYVSLTVGYDYNQRANNLLVMKLLREIIPDPEILDYLLKLCANALDGSIPNSIIALMVGELAENGKTLLMILMTLTFGQLADTLNPSVLTGKEGDATVATPHLAKLENKRLVCLSEPIKKGEMNTSMLKRLFGGEMISARMMRQNEHTFKMTAKAFLACNALPKIDPEDNGAWRRVVCIPFNQQFVSNPTKPHQHLADDKLAHLIETDISFRQTFINILISYLKKTVPIPEAVKLKTTRCRDSNDEFGQWLKDAIELKDDELLTLNTILKYYSDDAVRGTKNLAKFKDDVVNFLLKTFNIPESNYMSRPIHTPGLTRNIRCWKGIAIREEFK
jgi:phage/plasmid-associated DNA primase